MKGILAGFIEWKTLEIICLFLLSETNIIVFILLTTIAVVYSKDPRCALQSEDTSAVHIPHEGDCTKFYKCDQSHNLVEISCPDGLEFDTDLHICDRPSGKCNKISVLTANNPAKSNVNCSDSSSHGKWFEDTDDCTRFYICVNGKAIHQVCNPGQFFDKEKGYCNQNDGSCQPSEAGSSASPPDTTVAPSETTTALPGTTSEPIHCKHGTYQAASNGVCWQFEICVLGIWRLQSCNIDQMFNATAGYCVPDDGSCCAGHPTTNPTPATDPTTQPNPEFQNCDGNIPHGTKRPIAECCWQFDVCVDGEWRGQSCNADQWFNPEKGFCEIDTNGVCRDESVTTSTAPTTSPSQGCGPNIPHGSARPDPDCCWQFEICLNGEWQDRECGLTEWFNPDKNYCESDVNGVCRPVTNPPASCGANNPHGSFRPDPNSCWRFELCNDGDWIIKSCPQNQWFNPDKNQCEADTTGQCVENTVTSTQPPVEPFCDGSQPTGTIRPILGSCWEFEVCVQGDWRNQSCSDDQWFNPELNYCELDTNGNCNRPVTSTTTEVYCPCGDEPPGTLRPIDTCWQFEACILGEWRVLSCDVNNWFNATSRQCENDVNGQCRPLVPTTTESYLPCEESPPGSLRPTDTCWQFDVCVNGNWRRQSCNVNTWFNTTVNNCVPDENGQCRDLVATTTEAYLCCDGLEPGSVRPVDNCSQFEVCEAGEWSLRSCDINYFFNDKHHQCEYDTQEACQPLVEVTTASYLPCDGQEHGAFRPTIDCCWQFEVCLNGVWHQKSCPVNEYFSGSHLRCEYDEQEACRPHTATSTEGQQAWCNGYPPSTTRPRAGYCWQFEFCINGEWQLQSCSSEQWFDSRVGYCTVDVNNQCQDKIQPNPGHSSEDFCDVKLYNTVRVNSQCNKFDICVAGKWIPQDCNSGQRFDAHKQYCVRDIEGICDSPISPITDESECDESHHGSFKAGNLKCDEFYVCVVNQWLVQYCRPGERFDHQLMYCVPDPQGTCSTVLLPSANSTTQPQNAKKNCDDVPHGSAKSSLTECNKFMVCMNGIWTERKCTDGQRFDGVKKVCMTDPTCHPSDNSNIAPTPQQQEAQPPATHDSLYDCEGNIHGSFKASPTDCNLFYVCVYGRWIGQKCGARLRFDEELKVCVRDITCLGTSESNNIPETNKTGQFDTPTTQAAHTENNCDDVPHGSAKSSLTECNKFMVCMNGVWAERKCTDGQRFDGVKKVCVTDPTCHPSDNANIAPPPQQQEVQPPTTHDSIYNCDGLPDGSAKIWPTECNKFMVCMNGIWTERKCADGQRFDGTKTVCVTDLTCHATNKGNIVPPPQQQEAQSPGTHDSIYDCEGHTHGSFKNSASDCNLFYVCVYGRWIGQRCGISQRFNESLKVCVEDITCLSTPESNTTPERNVAEDNNIPATQTDTTCRYRTNGELVPHPDDRRKYFSCTNGIPVAQSCPLGQYFDATDKVCRQCQCRERNAAADCIGNHGKTLPDESDCSKFFACINGEAVHQSCTTGQWYDRLLGLCQLDDFHQCDKQVNDVRESQTADCKNLPSGTFLVDPSNGAAYFVCANGMSIPQKCPNNFIFNVEQRYCERQKVAKEQPELRSSQNSEENQCLGKHGELIADPGGCERFIACIFGKGISQKCATGEFFDSDKGYCSTDSIRCLRRSQDLRGDCAGKPEAATIANIDNPNKFYVCINNSPVPQECEKDEIFSTVVGYCLKPKVNDNAGASINASYCFGKTGKYVPGRSCSEYHLCVLGQDIVKMCGMNQRFDAELQKCVEDKERQCIEISPRTAVQLNCSGLADHAFYPNYLDGCASFFSCVGGKVNVHRCPYNLRFNPITRTCDYDHNVECVDYEAIDPLCLGTVNGVANVNIHNDCRSFYVCSKGVAHHTKCGQGLLYNANLGVCDWSKNVPCVAVKAAPLYERMLWKQRS